MRANRNFHQDWTLKSKFFIVANLVADTNGHHIGELKTDKPFLIVGAYSSTNNHVSGAVDESKCAEAIDLTAGTNWCDIMTPNNPHNNNLMPAITGEGSKILEVINPSHLNEGVTRFAVTSAQLQTYLIVYYAEFNAQD